MKRFLIIIGAVLALVAVIIPSLPAEAANKGGPPDKWEAKPPYHTHYFIPGGKQVTGTTSYYGPAQIRHAYGFDQLTNNGSGQTIAIVDAYDDPNAAGDLATFDNNFGIAAPPSFTKIYAQGTKPRTNSGWVMEISLDIEWAHAIAPKANILLVEATNAGFSSLMQAVSVAVQKGATVVSMSWGGSEFSGETSYDSYFNHTGVTFTAASGDSGTGTIYPAVSPYVVSVGGTTLHLDLNGNLTSPETAWSGSGGGASMYESEPSYQKSFSIPAIANGQRGNPDVSYDADPNTGFLVYDSVPYYGQAGWWIVGGTSAGAPQWTALIALANQGRNTPLSNNNSSFSLEYNAAGSNTNYNYSNYNDITTGSNGNGIYSNASPGYDFVTGLGSPHANNLVPYLNTH